MVRVMTKPQALNVLQEMQKWRRGEYPYDDEGGKSMPYEPEEFGEAIDVAIEELSPEF